MIEEDCEASPLPRENIVPPAPRWWRIGRPLLYLIFFGSLTMVWLVQTHGCQGRKDSPVLLQGWQLPDFTRGAEAGAGYAAMGLCLLIVVALTAVRRRRSLLSAAGRSALEMFGVLAMLLILLAVPIGYGVLHPAIYRMGPGILLGGSVLGLAMVVETVCLVRMVSGLVYRFRTSQPWRLIRPLLAPVIVLNFLSALAIILAATLSLFSGLEELVMGRTEATPFRFSAVVIVELLGAAYVLTIVLATWGLVARQRWAAWAHLALAAFLVALICLVRKSNVGFPGWAGGLHPVMPWYGSNWMYWYGGASAWGLVAWILGLLRSGGCCQRGVCWSCGRKHWRRVERCPVCHERYWSARDRATADVCLACGHERPGPIPTCFKCWARKGWA